MKNPILTLFVIIESLFLGLSFVVAENIAPVQLPSPLPVHPRIFLTPQKRNDIKTCMKTDDFLVRQVDALIQKADKAKTSGVSQYLIPDGKRLLAQSRRSLDRTTTLAFAYQMTGQQEYADAAIEEMLTVCRFKDWNPSHYLDTAEMATAVALGYDWLFDVLSDQDKAEIRMSLKKHALDVGLDLYKKNSWWVLSKNNWNEVCNCGMTIAALAVAEDDPELAEQILTYAVASLPNGLSVYKPDGAYPEGPGYWDYGATFSGVMIMALLDVFDDDFGFLETPGLNVTGDYYRGMTGPKYRFFNYADCGEKASASPMLFALSQWYDRPDYAYWLKTFYEKRGMLGGGRWAVLQALWYNPAGTEADCAVTPRASLYRGIQDVVTMRTDWNDMDAMFVGFKAGDNKANHGHLDIGSFVLEAGGVRWVSDMGADNYNLPGYFGKQRWDYYRNTNRSHNTLVIGDKIQDSKAVCRMIDFEVGDGFARAVCDMTAAYPGQVKSAIRTAILDDKGRFILEDRLEGVEESVRWGIVTQGEIAAQEKSATLTLDGKTLDISMISENVTSFEIFSTQPQTEAENQNQGYSMLGAYAKPIQGRVDMRVEFRLKK